MVERVECAVVGAGAVGLAIGRALARAGREVVLLEAQGGIGCGVSSRNSEVIHAGMYYPEGSLKARLCVAGNRMLRGYLAAHGVGHKLVGKLIVANGPGEEAKIEAILLRGRANGVDGLDPLDGNQVRRLEPEVACTAALWSPSTGILDTHGYMLALQGDMEDAGGVLAVHAPVEGGEIGPHGIALRIGGAEPMRLLCDCVVNAAGLGAQGLARSILGLPPEAVPRRFLCKGNYFVLGRRGPFERLVYPMPDGVGLGVHYTLDLAGQGRFGPDVEWIDEENYDVDPRRADAFYAAVRRYWPRLADGALQPGYSGIRPKVHGPGEPVPDFVIQGPEDHGVNGLVNLFGIESPGLTSSLAIAERVAGMLE